MWIHIICVSVDDLTQILHQPFIRTVHILSEDQMLTEAEEREFSVQEQMIFCGYVSQKRRWHF